MTKHYKEVKAKADFVEIEKEVLKFWDEDKTFEKSVHNRDGAAEFVFYDGPPFANGTPHYGHIMVSYVKDVVARYQTMNGKKVERRLGWDCHGLPAEMSAEKQLGVSGRKQIEEYGVEKFNDFCRSDVLKYSGIWVEMFKRIGRWVDFSHDYKTMDLPFMESVINNFKQLWEKGLVYEDYRVLPYSWAAETPLSNFEVNQGYQDKTDNAITVMFTLENGMKMLVWTTTPWTLPSNLMLAVGKDIDYAVMEEDGQKYVLAQALLGRYKKQLEHATQVSTMKGADFVGMAYEPMFPYFKHLKEKGAFRVLSGEFVSTEDGTGIVHIAPGFGQDDFEACRAYDENFPVVCPAAARVDMPGNFTAEVPDYLGKQVFETNEPIMQLLKEKGILVKKEQYTHSYPFCWRTDTPLIYKAMSSWFVKVTDFRDDMVRNNQQITWVPEHIKDGRFGKWLENLNDWNLSRSRYWGTPLPIWRSEEGEELCIGSVEELYNEIEKSIAAGFMTANPYKEKGFIPGEYTEDNYDKIDLHRPYVDDIILVSESGKPMKREADLIDVWFDSGAMPYAQLHYPFENKDIVDNRSYYPADFIAEGVDQTRGWFFTLHAIATMVFDSVAYKNVISNGLVLDKNGNKMSKRLGNAVDPFGAIEQYGSDPLRWYMITNSSPWDNLKFDTDGVMEVTRKFFGTLHNTYKFFAPYANLDGFTYQEADVPMSKRPEIDRWILSELNSLIKNVDMCYADYEPTKAGRLINDFVNDNLSNWYVRLCRKRFWGTGYTEDKLAAYQTLYVCLETVAKLMAPIAPFYADKLYMDLIATTGRDHVASVHLADFPVCDETVIDKELETRMELAQKVSSMGLALRKKINIIVKQPLQKLMIPVDALMKERLESVKSLIMNEVNVKEIDFVEGTSNLLVKKVKCNFKILGKKFGSLMKQVAAAVTAMNQEQISVLENEGKIVLDLNGTPAEIETSEVEIFSEDIPGWVVANEGVLTVALDTVVTEELRREGIARELVSKIQNIRKGSGFEITDKIKVSLSKNEQTDSAVKEYNTYICNQVLANSLNLVDEVKDGIELSFDDFSLYVSVVKE